MMMGKIIEFHSLLVEATENISCMISVVGWRGCGRERGWERERGCGVCEVSHFRKCKKIQE